MKRDMDLVREIMKILHEHQHGNAPRSIEIEGYTQEAIGYHCFILDEAGLIRATNTTHLSSMSPTAIPLSLTWEGHEFIDNALNEETWKGTKEAISKIGDASFSVWASVLTQVVSKNLGI